MVELVILTTFCVAVLTVHGLKGLSGSQYSCPADLDPFVNPALGLADRSAVTGAALCSVNGSQSVFPLAYSRSDWAYGMRACSGNDEHGSR